MTACPSNHVGRQSVPHDAEKSAAAEAFRVAPFKDGPFSVLEKILADTDHLGRSGSGVSALLLSAHVPAKRIVRLLEQTAIPQTDVPANPALGYALMRAAFLRGKRFPRMSRAMAQARLRMGLAPSAAAERRARRFGTDPGSIPRP